jgi:hypothetical protein
MNYISRMNPAQRLISFLALMLLIFFIGFWVARSTSASTNKEAQEVARGNSRYQFMQIGDTVTAIDIHTGETYAIDGNTRSWILLAPALPAKPVQNTK